MSLVRESETDDDDPTCLVHSSVCLETASPPPSSASSLLLNGNTQSPTSVTRRRSLSVASTKPSVETVVVRAKRAASSLWMLLHAQKCTLAANCPTPGCRDAKLLLLHIKTCSCGSSARTNSEHCPPCPENYQGCESSRKLLAHYKRCRTMRIKQVAGIQKESHHCLVCSLVARQARSILDRPRHNKVTPIMPPPARAMKPKKTTQATTSSSSIPNIRNVITIEQNHRTIAQEGVIETIQEEVTDDQREE